MVVPVGAHQVGQQLGVAGIRLRTRDIVAVTVAGHRQRIDPEHLIAGRDQRLDPQAAVGFNADHDLVGFLRMAGDQLMKPADSGESFGQPP